MATRSVFTLLLLLFSAGAVAQTASSPLLSFNEKQIRIKRIGMLTLGGWAAGNMAVSGVAAFNTTGSTRYFHQMNVYWNVVNLALAGFGYYGATKADPAGMDLAKTLKDYYGTEKTLLFNAGLDVGYILGGLYLTERAKHAEKGRDQLKGFGQSVMLQGGFLLLFDTAFYLVLQRQEKLLPELLSGLTFTGNAVAWVVRF
jgi:hypothetical protein